MPSLITLKRRIGSVRSTRQITRAMELVSASKLRRAQDQAVASRDYRQAAYRLLAKLTTSLELEQQPLLRKRTVRKRLYVIMTSNTGLAGAYNANVLKVLLAGVTDDQRQGVTSLAITLGSYGAQFVRRLSNVELLAHYPAFGDHPVQAAIQPLLRTVVGEYVAERVDEVRLIYTLSHSSIHQEVMNLPLLPAQFDLGDQPKAEVALNFEPDAEAVVKSIVERLIEIQLWQAVLESLASEHAMRMVAMKNATDNATDLIGDYQLTYNTERQGQITQAIAEITGGAEALR